MLPNTQLPNTVNTNPPAAAISTSTALGAFFNDDDDDGFVFSYTHIPTEGPNAFQSYSMGFTSEYAQRKVLLGLLFSDDPTAVKKGMMRLLQDVHKYKQPGL
jgi:hypothetical protein